MRMRTRTPWFVACASIMGLSLATTALTVAQTGASAPLQITTMSNGGEPVAALSARQMQQMAIIGVAGGVRLLGARAGTSFYTARSGHGGPCFLTSRSQSDEPEFAVVACTGPKAPALPSSDMPLVDFSALKKAPGERLPRVQWLSGFAADGVAEVGLVDESGDVHVTPVVRNVYSADGVVSESARAIVALDGAGREMHRMSLAVGP
jgi:hypothetical protein